MRCSVRRLDAANPVIIFTITIFSSATLLFLIEPMIAKMLLPKFGGTPAVWGTCMLFFQASLLAGYAYAHAATKHMSLRNQIYAQVGLLTAAVLMLPLLRLSARWEPPGDADPGIWVLALMAGSIGLPFFVISTSAPLLQKWFSETGHRTAKDPYFLYAASNVGSMATLLAYPFLVEPWLTIPWQNYVWMMGYVGLLAMTSWCGYLVLTAPPQRKAAAKEARAKKVAEPPPPAAAEAETNGTAEEEEEESVAVTADAPGKSGKRKKKKGGWREAVSTQKAIKPVTMPPVESITAAPPEPEPPAPTASEPAETPPAPVVVSEPDRPSFWKQVHWCALAFVPSSLFIGVTTYMTTDIASMPLLWIIPLTLYLLTFIIVFSHVPPTVHQSMVLSMPVFMLILVFVMVSEIKIRWIGWLFLLHLATLFVVSMVCHGELAKTRPSTRYLTKFYLCMSIGGTLGGLFNFLAPVIFNSITEYSLVLVIACLLLPALEGDKTSKLNRILDIGLAVALGAAACYALPKLIGSHEDIHQWLGVTGFPHVWQQVLTVVLVAGAMIAYAAYARKGQRLNRWLDIGLPIALGILTAQLIYGSPFTNWTLEWITEPLDVSHRQLVTVLTYGLPVALCYGFAEQPIRFGLGVAAIFLAGVFNSTEAKHVLHQDRSFFGVLKVEARNPYDDPNRPWLQAYNDGTIYHRLLHGTTLHGMQRADNMPLLLLPLTATNPFDAAAFRAYGKIENDDLRMDALTYYHRTGPIGQIYANYCPKGANSAFIGLGTGTMAAYLEPGQHGDIYEIDRKVVDIASDPKYFSYLPERQGLYDIKLGDARLKLKDAPDGSYNLIVVDAFSSDAIPVHLITKEALQLYLDKLAPNGVMAIHISNRHLRLGPVLGNIARELGLYGLDQYDEDEGPSGKNSSDWVVIARNRDVLQPLIAKRDASRLAIEANLVQAMGQNSLMLPVPFARYAMWEKLDDDKEQRIWTDDFSNILSVLRWGEKARERQQWNRK